LLWIGLEFFGAAGAAEVILFASVLVGVFRGGGIDVHPANGVAFEGGSGGIGSHRATVSSLLARSLARLVKAAHFGMTHSKGNFKRG